MVRVSEDGRAEIRKLEPLHQHHILLPYFSASYTTQFSSWKNVKRWLKNLWFIAWVMSWKTTSESSALLRYDQVEQDFFFHPVAALEITAGNPVTLGHSKPGFRDRGWFRVPRCRGWKGCQKVTALKAKRLFLHGVWYGYNMDILWLWYGYDMGYWGSRCSWQE